MTGEDHVEPTDTAVEVAEMFGQVARELLESDDLETTLDTIVKLAEEHLERCESAGISFVEGHKITSPASSGEIAATVDKIQQEVDEGPCLDALREHEIVNLGCLATEHRWPNFAKRAHAETGVKSILSVRLYAKDDNTFGALNLYSTQEDAFDDAMVALATVFATHAAVAIASAERIGNLERKAETRDLIGRAKGILMTQRHVTDQDAFDLLRAASQRLNIKLTQVADQVTYTGDLPP